jgi:hypothetical protein
VSMSAFSLSSMSSSLTDSARVRRVPDDLEK